MKPHTPSHSLQYINAHIKTKEILFHLHQDLNERHEEYKKGNYESPLVCLRDGIRLILEKVKEGEVIPLSRNPYNHKVELIFNRSDLDKAIKYDIKLLKQQLKELDRIYDEIKILRV